MLTPALLRAVSAALDEHGISHGILVEGPEHMNFNASDRDRVFVKVTRPGDTHERARTEVASARWATSHSIACPAPLLDAPLFLVDEDGASRAVSVWARAQTCTSPALADRAIDALGLIEAISSAPIPDGATTYDPSFHRDRALERLGDQSDAVSQSLRAATVESHALSSDLLPTRRGVWSHGDLHLWNIGWCTNGRPVVFDWEFAGTAPVEVDLAKLLRSIYTHTRGYLSTERDRVGALLVSEADLRLDVDWALVDALIRLFSAASAAAVVHGSSKHGWLESNLELAQTTLAYPSRPHLVA